MVKPWQASLHKLAMAVDEKSATSFCHACSLTTLVQSMHAFSICKMHAARASSKIQ